MGRINIFLIEISNLKVSKIVINLVARVCKYYVSLPGVVQSSKIKIQDPKLKHCSRNEMLIQHAVVNQFDNKNKSPWYSSTTFVENTDPYPFCKFRRNFVSKASFHKSDKQTCNWSLGILKSLLSLSRNQYYLLNNLFDGC